MIPDLNIDQLLTSPPPMMCGLVIMMVMEALKRMAGFPPTWIPIASLLAGAVGYPMLAGWTANNVFLGFLIGGFPVGLHQSWKQPFSADKREDDAARAAAKPDNDFPRMHVWVVGALMGMALLCFTVGCATPQPQPQPNPGPKPEPVPVVVTDEQLRRVAVTAATIQTGAQIGTYYALRNSPESRVYFEGAQLVLALLLENRTYSPSDVRARLVSLEGFTDELALATSAALNLYDVWYGEQVRARVDQEVFVRPLLVGLRDGIAFGLNAKLTEHSYGLSAR